MKRPAKVSASIEENADCGGQLVMRVLTVPDGFILSAGAKEGGFPVEGSTL